MKKYRGFYLKIFEFLEMKSSIYLNRHVFVMFSLFRTTYYVRTRTTEPGNSILYKIAWAPSEDSADPRSLIRVFTIRLNEDTILG